MTKADLISIVAKRLDITQVQSGIIVEAALRSIVSALQGGQEVEIRGFGSFRFRNRAAQEDPVLQDGEGVESAPERGAPGRSASSNPYLRELIPHRLPDVPTSA
jgi:integration host factor subunit beta